MDTIHAMCVFTPMRINNTGYQGFPNKVETVTELKQSRRLRVIFRVYSIHIKNLLNKDTFVNAKTKLLIPKINQSLKLSNCSNFHLTKTKLLCFHKVYKLGKECV